MFRRTNVFLAALAILGGSYVLLILLMVAADVTYLGARLPATVVDVFSSQDVRDSLTLSLITCTLAAGRIETASHRPLEEPWPLPFGLLAHNLTYQFDQD